MQRVLVTGASGFVGKQMIELLRNRGHEVQCLVRPTSNKAPLEKLGTRLIFGDVTDPQSLPAAIANVDTVYHLAGQNRANNLAQYCRVNELGVKNVLEACAARTTPPVVVLMSSLSAAGAMPDETLRSEGDPLRPISHYGLSKRAGEIVAESMAGKMPITVLRPPAVFGPGDPQALPLFRSIHKLGVHLLLGMGKRISMIYVVDLAAAAIRAVADGERLPTVEDSTACNGQGYYFLAANQHPMYTELGDIVARAVGRQRVRIIRIPRFTVYALAAFNEIPGRIFGKVQYLNLNRVKEIQAGHWICSSEKAHRQLGFIPAKSLDERFAETAQWYQNAGLL